MFRSRFGLVSIVTVKKIFLDGMSFDAVGCLVLGARHGSIDLLLPVG